MFVPQGIVPMLWLHNNAGPKDYGKEHDEVFDLVKAKVAEDERLRAALI